MTELEETVCAVHDLPLEAVLAEKASEIHERGDLHETGIAPHDFFLESLFVNQHTGAIRIPFHQVAVIRHVVQLEWKASLRIKPQAQLHPALLAALSHVQDDDKAAVDPWFWMKCVCQYECVDVDYLVTPQVHLSLLMEADVISPNLLSIKNTLKKLRPLLLFRQSAITQ